MEPEFDGVLVLTFPLRRGRVCFLRYPEKDGGRCPSPVFRHEGSDGIRHCDLNTSGCSRFAGGSNRSAVNTPGNFFQDIFCLGQPAADGMAGKLHFQDLVRRKGESVGPFGDQVYYTEGIFLVRFGKVD